MPEIVLLDPGTIDKIAAGEVVERPVSVVKELVENAIDAGATAVTVEIQEGGISFIRITDNGCGISRDQVQTAFMRHATSKIRNVEDLLRISSLGFRGEALSSIAAVAKVEMITKTADHFIGTRYEMNGGADGELSEIGAPDGTTIMVRNLFYNIPVRRKFLKSAATEGSYIAELMEHMALSKPNVSFKYVQNRDTKFHTSGNGDVREVIYRIYGKDVTGLLLPVDYEQDGIHISGFVGKPEMNRANRNFENYYVNHRYIKSDIVAKAIEEAYKPYLMLHKYPFCVLNIDIAASEIDVNVHPSKMEIRFIRQQEFFDTMFRAVTEALEGKEMIPAVILDEQQHQKEIEQEKKQLNGNAPEPFEKSRLTSVRMPAETVAGIRSAIEQPVQNISEIPVQNSSKISSQNISNRQEQKSDEVLSQSACGDQEVHEAPATEENSFFSTNRPEVKILGRQEEKTPDTQEIRTNVIKQKDQIVVSDSVQMEMFTDHLLDPAQTAEHHILGQIFDTYWLVGFQDKLFIIDQHAAHEKVKYERLMKHLKEKEMPKQMLAPPLILKLTARSRNTLREYEDQFAALGFELEDFGGTEVAIRTVPMDLYGCNETELFQEILDELATGPIKGAPEVIHSKLASMACKSAVKGNTKLTFAEAEELISELLTLENPYHCPHGRPTIISMSKYEIEKKFKRII